MDIQSILVAVTSIIGFISLSNSFLTFFRWVWVAFLRSPKNLKGYGSWAIITGSTGGLGKAMAFELASRGLNLVLTGRNPSELQNVSNAIHEKFNSTVEVKYIVMDFLKDRNVDILRKIEAAIDGLDVGLLINNAGVAYPIPQYFHEVESDLMDNVIGVNLDSLIWMTKAVIPVMLKKKKGCIVNIGSASAATPAFPLYALYAATKSCVKTFSTSLSMEYQQHGIDVQCQEPMFADTKIAPTSRASFLVPSAETHTRASVRWIGYERSCMPYWTHNLQWWIMSTLPEAWFTTVIIHCVRGVRKRGVVNLFGFDL